MVQCESLFVQRGTPFILTYLKRRVNQMNYGTAISWVSVVLCVGSSVGYFCAGDVRRALYFFFAACITVTVIK
jgi:hypothetical protein